MITGSSERERIQRHSSSPSVPGRSDYSPLWAVRMVTWKEGVTPRVLRSKRAVDVAVRAGQATVAAAPVVVNCPVL
jgi:hypothetical protein